MLFAVLIPISVVGEIARLKKTDDKRIYDPPELMESLSRIILEQDAEMWLISINKQHIDEFITLQKQIEINLQEMTDI
jgi:hypothetical protein